MKVYVVVDELDRFIGVYGTREKAIKAGEDHLAIDDDVWMCRHYEVEVEALSEREGTSKEREPLT